MQRRLLSLLLALAAGCGGATTAAAPAACDLRAQVTAPDTLTVTVGGLENGALGNQHVFNGFGCTGENHSPELTISGAPEGTRSFVVEVHDPDAPTGVGWFHWVVFDLPATTTTLAYDASATGLPEGAVQSRTDYGAGGWGGPCPPPGAPHRYVFTVYALDVEHLGLDANMVPAVVRFSIRDHVLGLGRTIATYGR